MQVSARADYAVRALLGLAAHDPEPMTAQALATEQDLPGKFLESILTGLRRAGLVASQRGPDGGYRLARPPETIAIAHVLRAVDGPLAAVRGERPEAVNYAGAASGLRVVWAATRAAIRDVLDEITLADVVAQRFGDRIERLLEIPDVWEPRGLAFPVHHIPEPPPDQE